MECVSEGGDKCLIAMLRIIYFYSEFSLLWMASSWRSLQLLRLNIFNIYIYIQASLEVQSYGTISGKIILFLPSLLLLLLLLLLLNPGPIYEFVSKGGSIFGRVRTILPNRHLAANHASGTTTLIGCNARPSKQKHKKRGRANASPNEKVCLFCFSVSGKHFSAVKNRNEIRRVKKSWNARGVETYFLRILILAVSDYSEIEIR